MSDLDKNAQKAMADVDLLQNEQIVKVWEADGFFLGTNPIAKAMARIQASLVKITGGYIRIYLVVTNLRVLLVEARQVWCGCQAVRAATALALTSVKEAGVGRETSMCCFHSRVIYLQTLTQRHSMIVKRFSDKDLKEFLMHLSVLIINNSRTV
jgi:hypothetical protein